MSRVSRPEVVDVSALRMRQATVRAGAYLTYVICAAGAGYAVWTWESPHRTALLILVAAGTAGGVLAQVLPTDRIIRSRWREPFFLLWSLLDLGLIAALVVVDGSPASPLALVFFVPMVFSAMSYPLRSVVVLSAVTVLGYLALAAVQGSAPQAYVFFFAVSLSCTALMSAWQARNHEHQRAELARLSRADPLTSCLNRRGFTERAEAELAHATRTGQPLSLILLDLDRFKQINDAEGHAAGDEVLCWVSSTLASLVRPIDAVGRLGGDEFALLLAGTGEPEARAVLQRLRGRLRERAPLSAGIACFPLDGTDLDELLRQADRRLYDSRDGREPSRDGETPLSWAAALADAVDTRMDAHHPHSQAVAEYAVGMARRLGWDAERLELLRIAAMLHDVGKVGISDRILRKPAALDPDEYREIRRHPVIGAELVGRIEGMETVVPWIRHSHEHFDGSGYPDGLRGEAIPQAARILLVADAFDAMTSPRPYREPQSTRAAVRELERHAGTQFDPECVALLLDSLGIAAAQREP
jgi:diguanylate cyclase (GGDEF)-like protein/putative nucleotidyltransferase with HDIG domain